MLRLLPVLCLLAAGCYPVRNPVPPGPGADSALNSRIVAPVRDPADDPDTVSPVEFDDAPGDAGTFSPGAGAGAGGFGWGGRVGPPRPARVGPSAETLRARRSAGDGGGSRGLEARQRTQRVELDHRRESRYGACCPPASPRLHALTRPAAGGS